jgi:hypothetical protein
MRIRFSGRNKNKNKNTGPQGCHEKERREREGGRKEGEGNTEGREEGGGGGVKGEGNGWKILMEGREEALNRRKNWKERRKEG